MIQGQCSITLTEKNRKDSFMILAKKEETLKKWIEVIQLAQSVSFIYFFINGISDKYSEEMF